MNRLIPACLLALAVMGLGCGRRQEPTPAPAIDVQPPAAAPAAAAPAPEPAAVAPETIPDLPDFPGAVRVAMETKASSERGFTRKAEARFTVAVPLAEVAAFYQKAIAEKGWTVVASSSKADEVKWKLTKGTSEAEIELDQDTGKPLEIKLEREDR